MAPSKKIQLFRIAIFSIYNVSHFANFVTKINNSEVSTDSYSQKLFLERQVIRLLTGNVETVEHQLSLNDFANTNLAEKKPSMMFYETKLSL